MPGGRSLAFDIHEMARSWNTRFGAYRTQGNIIVGLLVDRREDVDRIYHSVQEAEYRVGQPPYDALRGSRLAIVIDPDGNEVGLKRPADDQRPTSRAPADEG